MGTNPVRKIELEYTLWNCSQDDISLSCYIRSIRGGEKVLAAQQQKEI